jgi:hypothetical protein
MILVLIRDLRWRLLALLGAAFLFYLGEPGLHQHEEVEPTSVDQLLAPTGISFSAANLAGLSVVVLLAGFIAAHRRRGYYRLQFSHPTRPLAFYGLRWGVSVGLAMGVAAVFFLLSQLAAWGTLRVSPAFLLQALMFAVIYGGLAAFFSAVLPAGDAVATGAVYFVTTFWLEVTVNLQGLSPVPPTLGSLLSFVLPPHSASTDVYTAMLVGQVHWAAMSFCVGYGLFWLVIAGLVVRMREWP